MALTAPRLAGLLLVALLVCTLARAARAQGIPLPVRVEAQGLTVRGEAGLEKVAERVARKAPRALAGILKDLPQLRRPPRVEVRLVKRAQDIKLAAPAGYSAPEWAAGVAYSRVGVVVVATRRGADSINVERVVVHELAHMALGAALGDRAPRWLHEGFAYLHSSDWSFARFRTLTGMAWSGNVIPIADLDHSFPAREHEASRAYAQSYDFVVFLARRGRYPDKHDDGDRWTFRAFLAEIAAGKNAHAAAKEVYNATLDELFEEWYQSLRQRYLLLPVGLLTLAIWVIAAILLVLAYLRRRRQGRRKLAMWDEEEEAAAAAAGSGRMGPGFSRDPD
jgi:hypothetical protein